MDPRAGKLGDVLLEVGVPVSNAESPYIFVVLPDMWLKYLCG